MTPAKEELYLVVVESAMPKAQPPTQSGFTHSTPWTVFPVVVVKEVKAVSPEAAADAAGVAPGGSARVVLAKHVHTFKRAEKAPLVVA